MLGAEERSRAGRGHVANNYNCRKVENKRAFARSKRVNEHTELWYKLKSTRCLHATANNVFSKITNNKKK